jgi:hypothetical protein
LSVTKIPAFCCMSFSDRITTDSNKYFSTAVLARMTRSAPSITDINSALFTPDGLKNPQSFGV